MGVQLVCSLWSSYRSNGLGIKTKLITPHDEYLALGLDSEERMKNYRSMFQYDIDEAVLTDIAKRLK